MREELEGEGIRCRNGIASAALVGERRMADRNQGSLGPISGEGAAPRVHAAEGAGGEPGGNVVGEFVDAARSAADRCCRSKSVRWPKEYQGSLTHCATQANRSTARKIG